MTLYSLNSPFCKCHSRINLRIRLEINKTFATYIKMQPNQIQLLIVLVNSQSKAFSEYRGPSTYDSKVL